MVIENMINTIIIKSNIFLEGAFTSLRVVLKIDLIYWYLECFFLSPEGSNCNLYMLLPFTFNLISALTTHSL